MRETFETATFNAAFSKDEWTLVFDPRKDKASGEIKTILIATQMVFGMGAAAAGVAGPVTSAVGGGLNALFAGLNGIILPRIDEEKEAEEEFTKSAHLGLKLGRMAFAISKSFVEMNNALMNGDKFLDSGDIRDWLKRGLWVNFKGIDEDTMMDTMNNLLMGRAIDSLWRTQKIYIIGGGKCRDGQGIGAGPVAGSYCRKSDDTAWYLYHWQSHHGIPVGEKRYGWIREPHGMYELGKDDYAGISVEDVIKSSLATHAVVGTKYWGYTPEFALDQAKDAMGKDGKPLEQGPSWEGIFTIPVCNVSEVARGINREFHYKYYGWDQILTQYSTEEDIRAWYCGPICDGDDTGTRYFIEAANMHGYDSFHHLCDGHGTETESFPKNESPTGYSPDSGLHDHRLNVSVTS